MLQKFAAGQILEAEIAEKRRIPDMWKAGHRVTFDYEPRPGYLYVRSRMISSRCNDNFDEFPAEEIVGNLPHLASTTPVQVIPPGVETGYLTFLGKPVFVNHHNANHRQARGVITQVALHQDLNRDRSPDTWSEGLMEVDALRYPKLALALVRKHIERTSMGVDVAFSICAACNNKATTPAEYCRHIPGLKGRRYQGFNRQGARTSTLIRETCHGLRFFENSLLVEAPADPTAYTLGDVQLGPGLEHLSRVANRRDGAPLGRDTRLVPVVRENGNRPVGHPMGSASELARPMREQITITSTRNSSPLRLVSGRRCVVCASMNTVANRQGDTECVDCGQEFHATALAHEAAGPKYPNPGDHPWFQDNPVHHDNIVEHWDFATDDEKSSGKNWYSDAHIIATALGEHHEKLHGPTPHGPAHLGAGIVAAYSPQMGWAGNMHNAARVLHEGKGLGGKGSGMFASDQQRKTADKMLAGERHEDALGGPKIQDFAHLIEHGGDKDPQAPRAVIDRHALSVATGKRMSEQDYSGFPKSQRHYYGHVVDQYHQAAKRITEQEGEHVSAHQVQAVTWLARQRRNQAEERAGTRGENNKRLDLGRERGRQKQEQGWQDWRSEHAPDLPHAGPGTGYVAHRKTASETYYHATPFNLDDEYHILSPNESGRKPNFHDDEMDRDRVFMTQSLEGAHEWGQQLAHQHGKDSYFVYQAHPRYEPDEDDEDIYSTDESVKRGRRIHPPLPKQGARRLAYGETKAPPDVDTLRDENCPVCGEANAWDGNECPVCGFVQPPAQFRDPDLDVAKQMDLRKGDGDLGGGDVPGLDADTNDRDRDGLDDVTGEPVGDAGNAAAQEGAFDEQPLLVCPNCGTEFEAGEPQTINTRDPQAGADSLGQPEAGDVCPACGKAELMTGTELEELQAAEEAGVEPGQDPSVPGDEDSEDLPFGQRPDSGDEPDEEEGDENPDEEEDSQKPVKQKGSPFKR